MRYSRADTVTATTERSAAGGSAARRGLGEVRHCDAMRQEKEEKFLCREEG